MDAKALPEGLPFPSRLLVTFLELGHMAVPDYRASGEGSTWPKAVELSQLA